MSTEAKDQFTPREVILNSGVTISEELVDVVTYQVKELIKEDLRSGLNEIAINAWEPEAGYYPFSGIKKVLAAHPDLKDTWFERDGKLKPAIADILKCCVEVDLGTNAAHYINPLPDTTQPAIRAWGLIPPKSPYTDVPYLRESRLAVNNPKTPW